MKIGFVGTGNITSALVKGLCTSNNPPDKILVSSRNEQNSKALEIDFEQVKIEKSNQNLVDSSGIVVLAVLPQNAEEIISPLHFKPHQKIISLLAGLRVAEVAPWVKPAKILIRSVPLPCSAKHVGPIVIYPYDEEIAALFGLIGKIFLAAEESEIESFSIITALMAPYYSILQEVTEWAADAGIERKRAADYIVSMFGALLSLVEELKNGDTSKLIQTSMTPGGINELAVKIISEQGGFDLWYKSLEAVKKRVEA